MIQATKYIGAALLLCIVWYTAFNVYAYYYNTQEPTIMLDGMIEGQFFADKLTVNLSCKHPYKIAHYSCSIDGKPCKQNIYIGKTAFQQTLSLPVHQLDNGKHQLSCTVTSGTKQQNSITITRNFYVDNADLQAACIKQNSENKILQGRCFHAQFQVSKPIKKAVVIALGNEYVAYPESCSSLVYETFIPIDCDQHPADYPFSIMIQDHVGNELELQGLFTVQHFAFKKKTLHVPLGALDRESEFTSFTEKDFETKMEELTAASVKEKLWQGIFEVPLAMTAITTEFGVQRIAQERGCYIHKALDMVASAPRSVVWASQSGIIVLKERYAHSGNTIVIDHGFGILTMYFHLEEYANIKVGQKIRKGNPIGTMGKTGYANGYHLHWEIRVGNVAVDPMQWTKRDFII